MGRIGTTAMSSAFTDSVGSGASTAVGAADTAYTHVFSVALSEGSPPSIAAVAGEAHVGAVDAPLPSFGIVSAHLASHDGVGLPILADIFFAVHATTGGSAPAHPQAAQAMVGPLSGVADMQLGELRGDGDITGAPASGGVEDGAGLLVLWETLLTPGGWKGRWASVAEVEGDDGLVVSPANGGAPANGSAWSDGGHGGGRFAGASADGALSDVSLFNGAQSGAENSLSGDEGITDLLLDAGTAAFARVSDLDGDGDIAGFSMRAQQGGMVSVTEARYSFSQDHVYSGVYRISVFVGSDENAAGLLYGAGALAPVAASAVVINDPAAPSSDTTESPDSAGVLGASLAISADGSLRLDPTAAPLLQALRATATAHETFAYAVEDDFGLRAGALAAVMIGGFGNASFATSVLPSGGGDASILEILTARGAGARDGDQPQDSADSGAGDEAGDGAGDTVFTQLDAGASPVQGPGGDLGAESFGGDRPEAGAAAVAGPGAGAAMAPAARGAIASSHLDIMNVAVATAGAHEAAGGAAGQPLVDGGGFVWNMAAGHIVGGGYDDGLVVSLLVDGDAVTLSSPVVLVDDGRTLVQEETTDVSQIVYTRKMYVPEQQSYARFIDTFSSVGPTAQTLTVTITSDLGSDSDTRVVATSSGDTVLGADDRYVITDGGADGASGEPTLLQVFAGAGGDAALAGASLDGDELGYTFVLELQPGETKAILHYAAQGDGVEDVLGVAVAIESGDSGAFDGLTADERDEIVNFDFGSDFSALAGDGSPGVEAADAKASPDTPYDASALYDAFGIGMDASAILDGQAAEPEAGASPAAGLDAGALFTDLAISAQAQASGDELVSAAPVDGPLSELLDGSDFDAGAYLLALHALGSDDHL